MALSMKETGQRINNTVLVWRSGQMELVTKVITSMARSMVKASSPGQMAQPSLESSLIIISMVQVSMNGLMAESSMETGETIKWKAMVPLPGQTEEDMWVSTMTT